MSPTARAASRSLLVATLLAAAASATSCAPPDRDSLSPLTAPPIESPPPSGSGDGFDARQAEPGSGQPAEANPVAAPTEPGCEVVDAPPFEREDAELVEAADVLATTDPIPDDRLAAIATELDMPCTFGDQGFDVALVIAVARFQLAEMPPERTLDGRLDDEVLRYLEILHPDLRYPDGSCPGASEDSLPACLLSWPDATDEQIAFMHAVYDAHVGRSSERRTFAPAPRELAEIEERRIAVPDVAKAARAMLGAMRESEAAERGERAVSVGTAYRSPFYQLRLWELHFPEYYAVTQEDRDDLDEGPHSEEAAELVADYIRVRLGAPGFSLHNRGRALDLVCTRRDGEVLLPTGLYGGGHEDSWCYEWLSDHAEDYGFAENEHIDEPWHWEYQSEP